MKINLRASNGMPTLKIKFTHSIYLIDLFHDIFHLFITLFGDKEKIMLSVR